MQAGELLIIIIWFWYMWTFQLHKNQMCVSQLYVLETEEMQCNKYEIPK